MKNTAAIQSNTKFDLEVSENAIQWIKAFAFCAFIVFCLFVANSVYASDGTEFDEAVKKWDGWVKGNLGKLAALIALAIGTFAAAIKKDWHMFGGAVVLAMGVGIIVGIINQSFTATI